MQIVINHLTRMQPGYICTAGIELSTGLHVRPVVEGGLRRAMLAEEGGYLRLGAIVDLGKTRFVGRTPEIEDRLFDPSSIEFLGQVEHSQLQKQCESVAKNSLADVFGPQLKRVGMTRAIPENGGLHSLGCCWATDGELLVVQRVGGPRLRMRWRDQFDVLTTAVADIRLFESDHHTLRTDVIERANAELAGRGRTLLAVGLSRPYRKAETDPPYHWLQVNNVFVNID